MESILERLIDVGGSFLVLSLVVEKIADFIKLHSKNLGVREKDKAKEKNREKGILWRNILIGVILALLMKADAIQMLVSGEPGEVIGWDNVFFYDEAKVEEFSASNFYYLNTLRGVDAGFLEIVFEWLQMLVGIFVTGVALSFGSKFWHDLLGLLYEVREAKAKLAGRR